VTGASSAKAFAPDNDDSNARAIVNENVGRRLMGIRKIKSVRSKSA